MSSRGDSGNDIIFPQRPLRGHLEPVLRRGHGEVLETDFGEGEREETRGDEWEDGKWDEHGRVVDCRRRSWWCREREMGKGAPVLGGRTRERVCGSLHRAVERKRV